mmetsp:Transcript_15580/g.35651  ORF Transcript_15580/g.35651 Transcript_15580/m.35651 type:complete len:243 (-) Transcript_15580:1742-2470(-)
MIMSSLLREDDSDVLDGVCYVSMSRAQHFQLRVQRLHVVLQSFVALVLLQKDPRNVVLRVCYQHMRVAEHLGQNGEALLIELKCFLVLAFNSQGLAHVVLRLCNQHVLLSQRSLLDLEGSAVVRQGSHELPLAKVNVGSVHDRLGNQHVLAAQDRLSYNKRLVVELERLVELALSPQRHSQTVFRACNIDVIRSQRSHLDLKRSPVALGGTLIPTKIVQYTAQLPLSSSDGGRLCLALDLSL